MKKQLTIFLTILLFAAAPFAGASARVQIDITQGNVEPMPIAVPEFITADGASPEETVAGWLDAATSLVAITRGADGAHIHTRNGRIDVPARKVEVVDTVGAGDSFNGGLLHGLCRAGLLGKELRSARQLDAVGRGVE